MNSAGREPVQEPGEAPGSGGGAGVRLQVFLAHAGAASRRGAEALIGEGRVTVNGRPVTDRAARVSDADVVLLDGKPLRRETRLHYLALHKPPGYICAARDPQGRPLAVDLLPSRPERVYNVGRLDYRSSGLVFFTNDGAFAARASHPGSGIEKEYVVEATGPFPDRLLEEFSRGLVIDGTRYQAERLERLGRKVLRVVLVEGKNREIRRVFSYFHLHPRVLRRVRIGPVPLGTLREGESRSLTAAERAFFEGLPLRGLPGGEESEAGVYNGAYDKEEMRRSETW